MTTSNDAFTAWMAKVDDAIAGKLAGLTSDDLIDQPYSDWFDGGMSPAAAAKKAVRNEMRGEVG